MISAQAVEAAALALHERHEIKGVYVDDVRRILEAAAPYMLAAAWDEGKDAVWAFLGNQDPQRARPTNPYRAPDAR